MSARTCLCSKTMPPSAKGGVSEQHRKSHSYALGDTDDLLLDSGSGDVEAGGPLCSRVNIWSGETS